MEPRTNTCKRENFPWICEPTEDSWFAAHKSHFAPVVLSPLNLTLPIVTGKRDNFPIGLHDKKFVKRKELQFGRYIKKTGD
jgi:hypothetical protein